MARKQTYTDDGKKTDTKKTVSKPDVVRDTTSSTNLAGVDYQKISAGTPKTSNTGSNPTGVNTQSYNLAGTNNVRNAGGTVRNNTPTNQGPYVSSSTNKKYVTGNDISKYQSTLSSMADSSTKKANQILNTLGSTFKSIADLGKANQDYQNGLRQERLEIGRERSYAKADKDRADLTNSITQEDFDQFYNLDGSEVDFDGKIKDLTSKKSTLENIVNTATNEGQKNSAQAELDEVLAQIENFNLLKQKREALSETYTLESLKSEGDEQGYRSYRDMFSHKNDNLLQRAGSAVSHLAVETANEVPTMVDQFVYKAKATAVQQNLDLINQAYENKEIDIDQYVKALADIDERIKQAQDEYSDSTSMMIRDVVNQYGANTYYGANDIEKVLLQAGESTAQFLLHYVIGKGIASVAYKDKALIEAGKNFVLENYGENVLAGLTDPDLLSYGVSALGGDIATISMSGVGMTEKINQLLDEGYDINTAYMNGLFTGLVSYATEKVGMDELVKTFGTKVSADILGKVIRSSVVSGFMAEGGEEFVEGLIDPFIDTVTLGTDYKVNGNELLMAFMLGGFSGGAMAGGSVAINYATEAVNVNRALKARTQNRATVNTLNRVGRLIIENRGEYNATKAEMDLLERNYSSMTEYQKEVYEGIKKFYEDGRRNYEAMSQTMGVEFADDQVSLSSPEENDHTVIQTLESDFNQEAQMINTLDELQEDVNSKLDPIIDAELSVRNKTQQLLNDSGYNMDADLFNSLDSNLQNEALVALDFAKIKGLDVNITDDAGIKEILLNNSSKVQNFAKTHSEEETNALLQNIVDGTNGLRVGEGIVINANKNPVLSTLVHELTHGTESSALYDVLKDVVSNTMDNWDATVENKAQIYDNVQDFKNAEERRLNAEQEVVAETVEKNLGNEKFLNDLIRYDYSAFSRLWQNIKSLGDSSETTRIKNAFEKAFRDNYGQGDMRYSVSEALTPEQLKADTDYMKAVDDGDMGKAKRLVKETARKNGYTVDVYHGTYNFGRTKFNDFGGALFLTDDPSVARNFSGDQPVRDIVGSFDANKDSIEDVVNYVKQNTWADNIREAKLSDFDQELERVKPNKSDIKKYGQEFYDRWAKNYEIAKKNKERFLKGEPFFYMRSNSFAYDYPNDPIISEERVREFAEENNFKNTKNGESNGGVYQMYLRPENMLEIEVGGNYYTDVPIPKELRKYARPEELERGYATSDQILRMASDAGYGTIKYVNMREGGDWGNAGVSNVYVSLDAPRNVKSADPVTYDDNGNVIPLSERFNPESNDIRYSYSRSTDEDAELNAEIEKWNEDSSSPYPYHENSRRYRYDKNIIETLLNRGEGVSFQGKDPNTFVTVTPNNLYGIRDDGSVSSKYRISVFKRNEDGSINEDWSGAVVDGLNTIDDVVKRLMRTFNWDLNDDYGNVRIISSNNSNENGVQYSYGYHYGAENIDYNKKSERLSTRSDRGSGAFGTGTYFFGEDGAERAKGYHFTDGKTEHKVDFSDYNLFKPANARDGKTLHEIFKKLDNNYQHKGPKTTREYWDEMRKIRDSIEQYEYLTSEQAEDLKARLMELGEEEDVVDYILWNNSDDQGVKPLYLDSDLRDLSNGKYYDSRHPNREYAYDRIKEYEDTKRNIWRLALILNEDEDNLRSIVNKAMRSAEADTHKADFDSGNYDSVGTRVMKALGYEGIDVRGIKELDNSFYGSVIYDLKPESVRYSYNKEEADKISKEDKDLIKRATKELSTVKDSTRKANTKAEVAQALNEVNETGDISNTTLGRLRQKVIESTLTRVPNDNYEIAKLIRQEMGWSSLPKKNWDVVFQTINDRFSIVSDDQYPSGYQDAKELIDNYLSDVGGKYIYLSPVEQGWISAEVYERTIEDAIKNATDVLKYGSTEQDIANSVVNEVSDYLDGTDASLERLAEESGDESVQNVQDENDFVPFEELTELSEYGNIEERHRREFRLLQEISQDLLRKSGRDGVWDSEERYRLLENAGVRKRVSEILRAELESRGYSDSNPNGLLEDTGDYKIYKDVDGQTFHDIFSIAQLYTPLGELVDVHPADTVKHDGWTELGYKETRNFISEDGMSGFAIEPDGNLISVFNASDKSGFLKSIAPFVRKNASKCDCYVLDPKYTGTNLPKMYNTIFGFEVDHIEEYNVEEYGDEKGIARRYENPPIAYMVNPRFTATQENQADGDLNMTDEELEKYGGIKTVETQKYSKKNIDKETGIFKPKAIIELESTIGKTTHEEEIKDGEEYAGKFAQELDNGADVDDLLQKMMSNELQNGIVRAYYVSQVLADRDMQSEYMELAQWARDIGNLGGKLVESNKILYDLDSTFSKAVYLTQVEENLKSEYKEHLKNKKGVDVEQTINEIFNEYANKIINSKTSREFRSAIGALTREVNRRMPKTIWDRIHQYRMLAMLSGAKTAVSNFVSNTFSLGLYKMNSMNQALLESAMQNVEIKSFDDKKTYRINQEDRNATLRKDSTATKRNRKLATEIWDSLGENEKTKYGIETEKIPDIIKNNLKIKNETTQSKLSKAVGGLFDTVQNVQGVLLNDAPFAKVAFVQKFDELARARGINTEKINKSSKEYARLIDDAYNYAQEVVSHNDTDISKTIANLTRKSASNVRINEDSTLVGLDKQIKRFKERANNGEPIYRFIDNAVSKLQKWFVPFYKTNASLLQKSLQYSPLEWGQVINDWGKVKAGRMEVVDMVEHMSKAVTGTELYLVGAIFGFLGLLKWEKDDEDYSGRLSIKIPGTDKGYTVDFIDPISTIFAKGVVLAQNISEQGGPFKTIEGLVRDYEDIFLSDELDMFSSMKDFFDTVGKVRKGKDDYGEYTLGDGATDIAFSVLNSYIPAIVRDVSRMIDPAKKVVYDTDNKKYLFNRLVNSTPFRTNLVDKKDATGRTINYTQPFTGNDVFDRILTQMVSRGKLVDSNGQAITTRSGSQNMPATSSDGYTQMAKDFQYKDENGDGFSDAHWIRDSVPSNIYPAGVQTELTPKEKETYGKTWTDTWTSGANYLADNDIYKGLSYENQADVVYELQGFARECIEADYCMANNLEMTEAQRTANEIRNFCTVNGKLDGKMLGLIALGTAKENKLASGGQRYVMAEQDEEGKTIRNSRQLAMRHIYEEAGIYDKIVEAVQNSDGALTYADFGLGKTVVEKYSDEKSGSDYQTIYNKTMKSSSKKSSKVSGGSAGGITKAKGGGSTKKLSMAPNPARETKVANSYLKAYADVFKRNSSKATSSSGGTVICPKCGNRVYAGVKRCPVCGTSL